MKKWKAFFWNFKLVFEILAEKQKYSKENQGMNIDQIAMFYISMDLSWQALQTNRKLFSNFWIHFQKLLASTGWTCELTNRGEHDKVLF